MIGTSYIAGATFVAGLLIAGVAQEWRFDARIDADKASAEQAQLSAVKAVDVQLVAAQAATEASRQVFQQDKVNSDAQIDDLQHKLGVLGHGLRIKATCAASVPAATPNAGGARSGTAELDAQSTSSVFELEKDLNQQYGLLQFCRSELQRRSLPTSAP